MSSQTFLYRLWEQGEQHLVARHYVLARRELEQAEAIAWRDHDAAALARIYLPLLEARRQIRYHAVEGDIVICGAGMSVAEEEQELASFMAKRAGTILLACAADGGKRARRRSVNAGEAAACRFAGSVQYEAQRTGRWIEALLLVTGGAGGGEVRIASQADPTRSVGGSGPTAPIRANESRGLRGILQSTTAAAVGARRGQRRCPSGTPPSSLRSSCSAAPCRPN